MISLGLKENEICMLRECKDKKLIEITRTDLPGMLVWEKLHLKFDEFNLLIVAAKTNYQKENGLNFDDDVFFTVNLCDEDNFNLDGTGFQTISQEVNQNIEDIFVVNFKSINDNEESKTDFEYTYAIIAKIGDKFYSLMNESLSEMMRLKCYNSKAEMQEDIHEKCKVLNEEETSEDSQCTLTLINL